MGFAVVCAPVNAGLCIADECSHGAHISMYDVVIDFCSQTLMAEFTSGVFPKEVAKGYS